MLALIPLLLASCTATSPTAEQSPTTEKAQVIVSSDILCNLTRELAAATVDLTCLMDADQDPHTYQATPSDRRAIAQASLFLYDGYNLSAGTAGLAESAEAGVKTLAVYEQAVPDPILAIHRHDHDDHDHDDPDDHDHDHDDPDDHDHDHDDPDDHNDHDDDPDEEKVPDPHVWHDVEHIISAVEIIATELATVAPDHAATYQENAANLTATLSALDDWIGQQIETIPAGQRVLVTTHGAFNYFVAAYGLESSAALQGVSTEETPSAATVKATVEKIQATQVPTIFTELTASNRAIATVAREAGVTIAETPLFTETTGTAGSYVGMMAANTCAIVDGLGGNCTPFEAE
ncbi:zinc ABC transporter substrate-binding protein [Spirulina sp. CCNP1310]|uniref:metal ABC transporter solute-binding protein, Zn/Mn family n=1 Tax=Spirulina sp. CCNP1310 TaxID=3110249 RepID=UPI002B1EBEA9|nr:zinc ABC transporter substrate-binding protein [Spirulina sp. CCNP1310]MEA5419374.1 zinc ABC transporter substrate-binding protein [Spirulina sp. CCNP1310]